MPAPKHIPHEHFIMALSALVMALSGVILTSHPAGAEVNGEARTLARVYCMGSDKLDSSLRGTAALIKIDQRNPKLKTTLIEKTDVCVGRRTVREYYCERNSTGISSKIVACAKDLLCDNGACVKPEPVSESTNASESPPAGG